MERPQAKRASEMDVIGGLFAVRFVEMGKSDTQCVELYIEDDEWYHLKCSFNALWLGDLRAVVTEAEKHQNKTER